MDFKGSAVYAYLDCFSGISGDMTLGALVDLGLEPDWLEAELRRLPLDGFRLERHTVMSAGIRATRIAVHADQDHHHRTWKTIRTLIEAAPYSETVRRNSLAVFVRIAEAEADIHAVALDKVHFHEVGGIDAIVDIVGSCLGFERLGIDAIGAAPLPQGRGLVRCAHGVLPVPAPATLAILKGIPVYGVEVEAELVTPTGAALAAGLAGSFGPLPAMTVEAVGYGAGTREIPDRPNLLRILAGRPSERDAAGVEESVTVIETAIDDMNPEIFGHLMDRKAYDAAIAKLSDFRRQGKSSEGQVPADPDGRRHPLIDLALGNLHLLKKDYPNAKTALERVVARVPQSADAWLNLATACYETGDYHRAAMAFVNAYDRSAKGEKDPAHLYFAAVSHQLGGANAQAVAAFVPPPPPLEACRLFCRDHFPLFSWPRGGEFCRQSAVLVTLYPHEGKMRMILLVRPANLRRHPGQIGFPGGAREERDLAPVDTALREASEE
ncbi:MAG: nickel pincer cofactor biosynthesis protein LarC, partial [Opitutae bacterium]|nr:nickel pincer cofactor biosynthesis protein LarC [Opitutae bacterium]